MSEVNIMRLNAFAYRERVADGKTVLLVPVGSVEQHGPHMPLGVDTYLSTLVAELVAKEVGALVGPTITMGYKSQQRSGGGNHIIGSFGFDAALVIETTRTLVNELFRHGVREIAFVNGHYENYQFVYEGVDLALRDITRSGVTPPKVVILSYWDFVSPETIERLYPDGFPGWDVEHGGVMETSLMLLHLPDLVDMEAVMDLPPAEIPPYDVLPAIAERTPASGCLSSAAAASAEKGQVLTESIVHGMVDVLNAEFPH
ncbi:creatininase [Buchananella hordeovulneris]|uniref:Creatininase n=1 Tax=Buchananella hordeovulneris TaxID=52770 RepID=A0A1Q5PU36_9ACTO|nr:creatininase [Buchananella hordeovulneris]MDO5081223.1 creatininase [Buchananella hordeovulneris]OKL51074.1 creatininase [Buchananella hordeovulneris]